MEFKEKWTYPDIEALRKELGMTPEKFAKEAGISLKYLNDIKRNHETGKYQPPGRGVFSAMNRIVLKMKDGSLKMVKQSRMNNPKLKTEPIRDEDLEDVTPDILEMIKQRMHEYALPNAPAVTTNLVETDHVTALMNAIIRYSVPNDAVTRTAGAQGAGRFILRKLFTRCPKCRHVDEETFPFTSPKTEAEAAEKALRWLEHSNERNAIPGVN